MAKRIVAVVDLFGIKLTEQQVQLYHPLLLPVLIGLIGSLVTMRSPSPAGLPGYAPALPGSP